MKFVLALLFCIAPLAFAQTTTRMVVGVGSPAACLVSQDAGRKDATLAAQNHAYRQCADFGDEWDLTDHWQLPGREVKGNPRDTVQCAACGTSGNTAPKDGYRCSVRMLPQACVNGTPSSELASNGDWNAKDRTSGPAKMETAANCVQIGQGESTKSLKNLCDKKIVVFWCHKEGAGNTDLACGTGADRYYYKLTTVLAAGQSDSNPPQSHPLNVTLDYGACYGDIGDYQYTDAKGGYLCKPLVAATNQTAINIITVNGTSSNEACMRARLQAMDYGTASECACQIQGSANICRVQYSGPKPTSSVINNLKAQLDEYVKKFPCAQSDSYCIKTRRVAIGVRG